MSIQDTAQAFTDLLKAGQHDQAAERFNDPEILSVEAMEGPMAEVRGADAVRQKAEWWYANHTVHEAECRGPFVNGDQFAVHFRMDVTVKETGERTQMEEVGLYTVRDARIVEERFFY